MADIQVMDQEQFEAWLKTRPAADDDVCLRAHWPARFSAVGCSG
ncbi:MAG: hypothetical protein U5N55_13965 [Cypionkella sp.]|nr:hypothetical protein [Cypionkella sp.]